MKIKYLSHSCFEISSNGKTLITDPFLTDNPKALTKAEELDPDYILVTHGHFDHVMDVEGIASRTGCLVVGAVEVVNWFQNKGLNNCHGLNFGGKLSPEGFTFKYLQAHHSSSMPDGSYGASAGSFMIDDGTTKLFLAGDTSLHYDMKMFGEVYHPDVSILPIGGNFTMDVEDAVIAAKYLGTGKVIGCHYDTMPVISIDHDKALKAFSEEGLELLLVPVGGEIEA